MRSALRRRTARVPAAAIRAHRWRRSYVSVREGEREREKEREKKRGKKWIKRGALHLAEHLNNTAP